MKRVNMTVLPVDGVAHWAVSDSEDDDDDEETTVIKRKHDVSNEFRAALSSYLHENNIISALTLSGRVVYLRENGVVTLTSPFIGLESIIRNEASRFELFIGTKSMYMKAICSVLLDILTRHGYDRPTASYICNSVCTNYQ